MGRADFKLVIESRIRVHTNRRVSRRGGKCRSSRRAYVRPGSQRLVRIAYASILRRRFGQLATRGSQYDSSALKHALPTPIVHYEISGVGRTRISWRYKTDADRLAGC